MYIISIEHNKGITKQACFTDNIEEILNANIEMHEGVKSASYETKPFRVGKVWQFGYNSFRDMEEMQEIETAKYIANL